MAFLKYLQILISSSHLGFDHYELFQGKKCIFNLVHGYPKSRLPVGQTLAYCCRNHPKPLVWYIWGPINNETTLFNTCALVCCVVLLLYHLVGLYEKVFEINFFLVVIFHWHSNMIVKNMMKTEYVQFLWQDYWKNFDFVLGGGGGMLLVRLILTQKQNFSLCCKSKYECHTWSTKQHGTLFLMPEKSTTVKVPLKQSVKQDHSLNQ
jgi:hypothetical protein